MQRHPLTPLDFGQAVAQPLPRHRQTIVDLNCGAGHLLYAAANKTTQHLLGSDIDPCRRIEAEKRGNGETATGEAKPPAQIATLSLADSPIRRFADSFCPTAKLQRLTADVTRLYPLLQEIGWQADLWALNPPWDLHLWRARLAGLAESELPSVREAFAQHDGRVPYRTIDSTVAMLLIALDRSTDAGEGLLIANNATLDRLIFAPGAPHGAVAQHVWARLVVEGNPMTGRSETAKRRNDGLNEPANGRNGETASESVAACAHSFTSPTRRLADSPTPSSFQTAIIYFARDHTAGLRVERAVADSPIRRFADSIAPAAAAIASARDFARLGARIIDSFQVCRQTIPLWRAVSDEWRARQQPARTDYNLGLTPDGLIRASLNLFEERSSRILKDTAQQLYQLHGKRPMELVLQRSQRELLLRQCGLAQNETEKRRNGETERESVPQSAASPALSPIPRFPDSPIPSPFPWRVDPKLQSAVLEAVREYHGCRAPLYPLPGLQRLGYLEEEDSIVCKKTLAKDETANRRNGETAKGEAKDPAQSATLSLADSPTRRLADSPVQALFRAGQSYVLSTQSVQVTRRGFKPNLAAEMEEVEYSGSELATFITDETGQRRCFMEARLRSADVRIDDYPSIDYIDFTLQELDEHFPIPDVPDVAALDPEGYQRNLALLEQLEQLINS